MGINGGTVERMAVCQSPVSRSTDSRPYEVPLIFSVALPHPQIFNLICSFHLLEDVSVNTMDHGLMENSFNEQQIAIQLQSSPVFTGFLQLFLLAGIDPIPSRSLSLPDCLRFRKHHQVRTFRSQRRS